MNSFGTYFRVSIFGESHGTGVGITLDGCPAGLPITEADFKKDIDRRKPGVVGTTSRREADEVKILSGVFKGFSTGAPMTFFFENQNTRSGDYSQFISHPRPGHADFTARHKFKGFTDYRGSGHFSGRLTTALVAAGVVAKKVIAPTTVEAAVLEVGGKKEYEEILLQAMRNLDSLGGIVECRAKAIPIGWGEPFFDSVESLISHIVWAIPAIRGIEFGTGFAAARMKGSEHNDCITDETGRTATNHAGGINGGITNGNEIIFRVAVKPTSSIAKSQETYHLEEKTILSLEVKGRHDAAIVLRVPVIIEAVTAIALADLKLRSHS